MFEVSLYKGVRDNKPRAEILTKEAFAQLLTSFDRRDVKEGPLWSPAKFPIGEKRRNDAALEVCALVLDFDGGQDWGDFLEEWGSRRLAFICHSTFNHSPEHPRWRAIFPLSKPVAAAKWPQAFEALSQDLAFGVTDASCKDVSRMYFLPSAPEGAEVFSTVGKGDFLEPKYLTAAPAAASVDDGLSPGDDYDQKASWEEILEPHGWQKVPGAKYAGVMDLWSRPGKRPIKGEHGARTGPGHLGDRFFAWTSSGLDPQHVGKPLRKWHVFAILSHNGDFSAAAKDLARRGFGSRRPAAAMQERLPSPEFEGLPAIKCNNRQLRDISSDGLSALLAANDPPALYSRFGRLARLESIDDKIEIKILSASALRGRLARVADWHKENKDGDQTAVFPPDDAVADIISLRADELSFPVLEAVSNSPIVGPAGIVSKRGYDKASQVYVDYDGGDAPPMSVEEAKAWILEDLLIDFPLDGASSIAHAIGLFLLPFVRPIIDGPTPLHLVKSSQQGVGKSLLARSLLLPALGYPVDGAPIPSNEQEFERRLFNYATGNTPAILLDNIDRTIKSSYLASMITQGAIEGRALFSNDNQSPKVRSCLVATGNNMTLNYDIARRCILIKLKNEFENPEKRTGFKHPNILRYLKENRRLGIGAALALIGAWLDAGKPIPDVAKGSFESWIEVIGGILSVAGIDGFLGNEEELKEDATEEEQEWTGFMQLWFKQHEAEPVTGKELKELADEKGVLAYVFEGAKNDRGAESRFGRALAKRCGRIVKGLSIEKAVMLHGLSRYKLVTHGVDFNKDWWTSGGLSENESTSRKQPVLSLESDEYIQSSGLGGLIKGVNTGEKEKEGENSDEKNIEILRGKTPQKSISPPDGDDIGANQVQNGGLPPKNEVHFEPGAEVIE